MTIREIIIKKRKEVGMTQKELSQKTGITQCRISEFESGVRQMNSGNIDLILSTLDIHFKNTNEGRWDFAGACATTLKEKGVISIDNLGKEEVADLTGSSEILLMKDINDKLYEELAIKGLEDRDSYNYMKTLISFRLACIK